MNRKQAEEVIELCRLAGSLVLVKTYWNDADGRTRQSVLERQRAMPKAVQAQHAAGVNDVQISRFCGLLPRTVQLMLAKEL